MTLTSGWLSHTASLLIMMGNLFSMWERSNVQHFIFTMILVRESMCAIQRAAKISIIKKQGCPSSSPPSSSDPLTFPHRLMLGTARRKARAAGPCCFLSASIHGIEAGTTSDKSVRVSIWSRRLAEPCLRTFVRELYNVQCTTAYTHQSVPFLNSAVKAQPLS